jgi:tetratricopeptide (TPR) repeat protein
MAKRKQEQVETEVFTGTETSTGLSTLIQNQKLIAYVLGGIALAVAGWFAYQSFIVSPQQKDAEANMWKAQQYFERDSFQLALESPIGDYHGFLAIIDKYGSSKAGNSAHYYAGVSYLQLGQFDKAIEHLEDFSPKDDMLPIMKYGALGDCYSEKDDLKQALSLYDKAISAGDNEILTSYYMKKAGMLCERLDNQTGAATYYKDIKSKYPTSPSGTDIDKFLARVGVVE